MKPRNRDDGQAMLTEVALAAILGIALATLAIDILVPVYGFAELDAATRDAARAAASGVVTSTDVAGSQALASAQQACAAHKTDGNVVTQPQIDTTAPGWIWNVPAINYRQSGSPYVTVTGRCKVLIPIPINFFGVKLAREYLNYTRIYTFPVLNAPYSSDVTTAPAVPPAPEEAPAATTSSSDAGSGSTSAPAATVSSQTQAPPSSVTNYPPAPPPTPGPPVAVPGAVGGSTGGGPSQSTPGSPGSSNTSGGSPPGSSSPGPVG